MRFYALDKLRMENVCIIIYTFLIACEMSIDLSSDSWGSKNNDHSIEQL